MLPGEQPANHATGGFLMEHDPPIRVLWVGDNGDEFIHIRSALASIPGVRFEVTWAASYTDGLDDIEQRRHDICLIDDRLGAYEGLEFLQVAIKCRARMPLILLTRQGDHALHMAAIRTGAADSLVKGQLAPSSLGRSIWHALERTRTLEALRVSEERYTLTARGANDELWDWDVRSGRINFSPRWKAMLGCEEHEIGDCADEGFNLTHPEDLDRLKQAIAAHLRGQTPLLEVEHRMRHKDGDYRWMLTRGLALWAADGMPSRIAGSLTDISARKMAEERLERNALYDGLTGLP